MSASQTTALCEDGIKSARKTLALEIRALEGVLDRNEGPLARLIAHLLKTKGKVVVTGLGKSGIIAHKIAATLASTGTPAVFLNSAEALHGDLGIISSGDTIIMLSKSAATTELLSMWPSLRRIGVLTVGFFGDISTELARKMDILFDLSVEREGCPLNLAPMASATVALVMGDLVASGLMTTKGFAPEDFALYHPGGLLGRKLLLLAEDVMHTGAMLPKVSIDASVKDIVLELTRTNLGAVGVIGRGERIVGFITDGDLRRLMLRLPSLDVLASDFMTVDFVSVTRQWPLWRVLELMENPDKLISVVPVVEEGKYCGVVRLHDVFR